MGYLISETTKEEREAIVAAVHAIPNPSIKLE